jgi:hypothetical protein
VQYGQDEQSNAIQKAQMLREMDIGFGAFSLDYY